MLVLWKERLRCGQEFDVFDVQAGLLERFSFGTLLERFAEFEVAARE